jgi:hypothetical protein
MEKLECGINKLRQGRPGGNLMTNKPAKKLNQTKQRNYSNKLDAMHLR